MKASEARAIAEENCKAQADYIIPRIELEIQEAAGLGHVFISYHVDPGLLNNSSFFKHIADHFRKLGYYVTYADLGMNPNRNNEIIVMWDIEYENS